MLLKAVRSSPGTFRVGVRKNFSYSSNVTVYPHAVDMWNGLIGPNFENVKSKLLSQVSGSQADADFMTKVLNNVHDGYDRRFLTKEEQELISNFFGDVMGGDNAYQQLVNTEGKGAKAAGDEFENRFDTLVQKIFNEDQSVKVGTERVYSPVKVEIDVFKDLGAIGSKFNVWNNPALISAVRQDMREIYGAAVGAVELEMKAFNEETKTSTLILRQMAVQGKVDIDIPITWKVSSTVSPLLQELGQRMVGKRFSLKNYGYNSVAAGRVSLGHAGSFRALSSFYFFATGDNNFYNVCTFVYSSTHSKNGDVQRYKSWARYIYELTGAGQESVVDGSGRLVDYLVVMGRNASQSRISVVYVGTLLENMPNGNPPTNFKFFG